MDASMDRCPWTAGCNGAGNVSCLYCCICTCVHCDAVLVALLLPFFAFALLCVPSVLISVLYSVWRLGKGTRCSCEDLLE